MIGANILISIKALCILPVSVYFFDKKYCTKSFRQPFEKGCGVGGEAPVVLRGGRNSIQNKRRRGGRMSRWDVFRGEPLLGIPLRCIRIPHLCILLFDNRFFDRLKGDVESASPFAYPKSRLLQSAAQKRFARLLQKPRKRGHFLPPPLKKGHIIPESARHPSARVRFLPRKNAQTHLHA